MKCIFNETISTMASKGDVNYRPISGSIDVDAINRSERAEQWGYTRSCLLIDATRYGRLCDGQAVEVWYDSFRMVAIKRA